MLENPLILLYLCIIISIQSCAGVGVLVLGTPFLLILDYNILEILFILLPLSILTSFTNFIIMQFSIKKTQLIPFKNLKKFFIVCIPSIIIGLFVLKYFENYINFKILVSIIIFVSIILILIKDKITFKINFYRISVLSIIGILHGITNSGGTLMSLVLSHDQEKTNARYSITFFYLLLAFFQYIITIIIFSNYFFLLEIKNYILLLIFGILLGNILIKFLNENKYKVLINFLALISSFILFFS